jgi:hypothetical protein
MTPGSGHSNSYDSHPAGSSQTLANVVRWKCMWKWLKKLQGGESASAPLTGAPPHRRQKTYTADSGYVYEYYYEGFRVAARAGETGAEHVFAISADRKSWHPVSVFLQDSAARAWEAENGRELNSTERYAIVKMSLFGAFDEREDPSQMRAEVCVRHADVAEILERLGID